MKLKKGLNQINISAIASKTILRYKMAQIATEAAEISLFLRKDSYFPPFLTISIFKSTHYYVQIES